MMGNRITKTMQMGLFIVLFVLLFFVQMGCLWMKGDPDRTFVDPGKRIYFVADDVIGDIFDMKLENGAIKLSLVGLYYEYQGSVGQSSWLILGIKCTHISPFDSLILFPDSIQVQIMDNLLTITDVNILKDEGGKYEARLKFICSPRMDCRFVGQLTVDEKPDLNIDMARFLKYHGNYIKIDKISAFRKKP